MVTEIRIYVEGGGDGRYGKNKIREGFHIFMRDVITQTRQNKIRWQIIACGSRNKTFDNFNMGIKRNRDAFNILLVDSESQVTEGISAIEHLQLYDKWDIPPDIDEEQIHMMVEIMESWFVADVGALKKYYGQGFNERAIPKLLNVEVLQKDQVINAIRAASRHTQKGEYAKIRHGANILKVINPDRVREHAPHCDRLFQVLYSKIKVAGLPIKVEWSQNLGQNRSFQAKSPGVSQ